MNAITESAMEYAIESDVDVINNAFENAIKHTFDHAILDAIETSPRTGF